MPQVYNWQLGREMAFPYEGKYPQWQFAFVMNINRCIACQTCTMACKSTWTYSKGQEAMWWANVETNPDLNTFPKWHEAQRYFDAYCRKHQLQDVIRFNTTVLEIVDTHATSTGKAKTQGTKRWCVIYRTKHESGGASLHSRHFDVIFCCTGRYNVPSIPKVPGMAQFSGLLCHSKDYQNPDRLLKVAARRQSHHSANTQPRVVIVGLGNSALDIALELATAGAQVILSYRTGTFIIPVSQSNGRPLDAAILNRAYQQSLPSSLRNAHFFWLMDSINKAFHAGGLPDPTTGLPGGKNTPGYQAKFSNLKQHHEWRSLLASGQVSFRPQIQKMTTNSVVFADSPDEVTVDGVVYCTGFKLQYPYLNQVPGFKESILREYTLGHSSIRWLNLYKGMLSPSHPGLCFLGTVTTLGNESCVGELQARWCIAALSKTAAKPLPSNTAMAEWIEQKRRKKEERQVAFPSFVNYVRYMDDLARDIGCFPVCKYMHVHSCVLVSKSVCLWAGVCRLCIPLRPLTDYVIDSCKDCELVEGSSIVVATVGMLNFLALKASLSIPIPVMLCDCCVRFYCEVSLFVARLDPLCRPNFG